jgi:predicted phage-related endonuclease
MEIADIEWTLICVLVGGNEAKFIYRERDREVGQGLRDAVRKFWDGVVSSTPPEPNYARDSDFIVSLHQAAGVSLLESDEQELIDRLRTHYDIGKEIKDLETERKEMKARIIDTIGDEYNKVKAGAYSLSCGMTKETPPTEITEEMVGESYGGRKSYRTFRVTEKKGE